MSLTKTAKRAAQKRLEKIVQTIARYRREENNLELILTVDGNQALVGNCYVSEEHFEGRPAWLVFQKVIGLDGDGWLRVLQFQRDFEGTSLVKTFIERRIYTNARRIPESEFKEAWMKFVRRANADAAKAGLKF